MILLILAIWFGYKKARDTGRNPYVWAATGGGVFIGPQLLVGVGFGLLLAIGQEIWGWDEGVFDKYSAVISIVALVFSLGALWLLFRFLDRRPPVEENVAPPPPPQFDQNDQN